MRYVGWATNFILCDVLTAGGKRPTLQLKLAKACKPTCNADGIMPDGRRKGANLAIEACKSLQTDLQCRWNYIKKSQ
jgi:hypothetical protein